MRHASAKTTPDAKGHIWPYTDSTDPLTREAADRIGRALWPDAEPQLGLQPETGPQEKTWGETPGHLGCAARDLNPEPAD